MTLSKENIISLLENISIFAYDNLKQIEKLNIDLKKESENFFLGIINRQYTLSSDLSILFKNKNSIYLGSQLILFRCIIDDFIHLTYIVNQNNSNEMMTKFNSDAYNKNFIKLKKLAELNETKLGGKYPNYPTYKFIDDLKENFKNQTKNEGYFKNKEEFKLKTFENMGSIIGKLEDESYAHQLRRAYYFWGHLSDFVHYSSLSFGMERNVNPKKDNTNLMFAEIIQYSFQVIKTSFEYFERTYNLELIDKNNLSEYYKDATH